MKTRLITILIVLAVGSFAANHFGRQWQANAERQEEARQIAAYETALDTRVTLGRLAGQRCTLEELIAQLRPQVDIPIVIDRADDAAEKSPSTTHLIPLPCDATLEAVLDHSLADRWLVYSRRGASLVIGAKDAQARLTLRQHVLPTVAADGTPIAGSEGDWHDVLRYVADETVSSDKTHLEVVDGTATAFLSERAHRRIERFLRQFDRQPGLSSSPLAGALSPAECELLAALDQTVSVEWLDMPLDDVGQFLREQYGIAALVDAGALAEAGISPQVPATLTLTDVSLRTLLDEVCRQNDLAWTIRHDVLLFSTSEAAESDLEAVAYDVRDLVAVDGGLEFDSLSDLICSTIEPESWPEGSGPPSGIYRLAPGWLVICQTLDVHLKIADFLTLLRRAKIVGAARQWERTPAGRRLAAALEVEVHLNHYDDTLKRLCEELREKFGINAVLDEVGLAEVGAASETPIKVETPRLPLDDALFHLLGPLELKHVVDGEVLRITSRQSAPAEWSQLAVYDLRAVPRHLTFDDSQGDLESDHFVELCLRPVFWRSRGCTCRQFRDLLVVAHDWSAQRQVNGLLAALKEHVTFADTSRDEPRRVWVNWTARDEAIWQKLHQKRELESGEIVLLDEFRKVCRSHEIPLVVDHESLRRQQVRTSAVVVTGSFDESLAERLKTLVWNQAADFHVERGALVLSAGDRQVIEPLCLYSLPATVRNHEEAMIASLVTAPAWQTYIVSKSKFSGGPGQHWVLIGGPRELHAGFEAQLKRAGQPAESPYQVEEDELLERWRQLFFE